MHARNYVDYDKCIQNPGSSSEIKITILFYYCTYETTKDTEPWRQVAQSGGAKGPSVPLCKIT